MSGRTNKLVDGCYSHWVGSCWPLIEACLNAPGSEVAPSEGVDDKAATKRSLPAPTQSLFSREGLIRYILCCCQDEKRGGLRDKPDVPADAYHTNYVLSGLSSAQHQWTIVKNTQGETDVSNQDGNNSDTAAEAAAGVAGAEDGSFRTKWSVAPYPYTSQIFDEGDRLCTTHPVYTVPQDKVDKIIKFFEWKDGF